MGGRRSDDDTSPVESTGEYATISLRSVWGSLSLLLFVAAVGARQLVRLLPGHLQGWGIMPPLAVMVVPPLALAGLLVGWVGLRRERRRTLAVLGVLLNGIVLVATLLFLAGFWWVRLR